MENNEVVQLARAVLAWASAPANHGGNPYRLPHVKLAEIMLAKHEGRKPDSWAKAVRKSIP